MPYRALCLTVALVAAGCSDGPTRPTDGLDADPGLRPSYHYMARDTEVFVETSRNRLTARFVEGLSIEAIHAGIRPFGATIEKGPLASAPGLYVLRVGDAFAIAPLLARESFVTYVGPHCTWDGTHAWIPTNEILLDGSLTDPEVTALVHAYDGVVVISSRPPHRAKVQLPWRDAGEVFDLANELHHLPAITFAEPNAVIEIALGP